MAIVAQAEQNQVVSVNVFAALCRQEIKLILVFPRRDFRIDFTAHSHNRFFGNGGRDKERFARHPEIALRVIW
jgi:hypothetical protein